MLWQIMLVNINYKSNELKNMNKEKINRQTTKVFVVCLFLLEGDESYEN